MESRHDRERWKSDSASSSPTLETRFPPIQSATPAKKQTSDFRSQSVPLLTHPPQHKHHQTPQKHVSFSMESPGSSPVLGPGVKEIAQPGFERQSILPPVSTNRKARIIRIEEAERDGDDFDVIDVHVIGHSPFPSNVETPQLRPSKETRRKFAPAHNSPIPSKWANPHQRVSVDTEHQEQAHKQRKVVETAKALGEIKNRITRVIREYEEVGSRPIDLDADGDDDTSAPRGSLKGMASYTGPLRDRVQLILREFEKNAAFREDMFETMNHWFEIVNEINEDLQHEIDELESDDDSDKSSEGESNSDEDSTQAQGRKTDTTPAGFSIDGVLNVTKAIKRRILDLHSTIIDLCYEQMNSGEEGGDPAKGKEGFRELRQKIVDATNLVHNLSFQLQDTTTSLQKAKSEIKNLAGDLEIKQKEIQQIKEKDTSVIQQLKEEVTRTNKKFLEQENFIKKQMEQAKIQATMKAIGSGGNPSLVFGIAAEDIEALNREVADLRSKEQNLASKAMQLSVENTYLKEKMTNSTTNYEGQLAMLRAQLRAMARSHRREKMVQFRSFEESVNLLKSEQLIDDEKQRKKSCALSDANELANREAEVDEIQESPSGDQSVILGEYEATPSSRSEVPEGIPKVDKRRAKSDQKVKKLESLLQESKVNNDALRAKLLQAMKEVKAEKMRANSVLESVSQQTRQLEAVQQQSSIQKYKMIEECYVSTLKLKEMELDKKTNEIIRLQEEMAKIKDPKQKSTKAKEQDPVAKLRTIYDKSVADLQSSSRKSLQLLLNTIAEFRKDVKRELEGSIPIDKISWATSQEIEEASSLFESTQPCGLGMESVSNKVFLLLQSISISLFSSFKGHICTFQNETIGEKARAHELESNSADLYSSNVILEKRVAALEGTIQQLKESFSKDEPPDFGIALEVIAEETERYQKMVHDMVPSIQDQLEKQIEAEEKHQQEFQKNISHRYGHKLEKRSETFVVRMCSKPSTDTQVVTENYSPLEAESNELEHPSPDRQETNPQVEIDQLASELLEGREVIVMKEISTQTHIAELLDASVNTEIKDHTSIGSLQNKPATNMILAPSEMVAKSKSEITVTPLEDENNSPESPSIPPASYPTQYVTDAKEETKNASLSRLSPKQEPICNVLPNPDSTNHQKPFSNPTHNLVDTTLEKSSQALADFTSQESQTTDKEQMIAQLQEALRQNVELVKLLQKKIQESTASTQEDHDTTALRDMIENAKKADHRSSLVTLENKLHETQRVIQQLRRIILQMDPNFDFSKIRNSFYNYPKPQIPPSVPEDSKVDFVTRDNFLRKEKVKATMKMMEERFQARKIQEEIKQMTDPREIELLQRLQNRYHQQAQKWKDKRRNIIHERTRNLEMILIGTGHLSEPAPEQKIEIASSINALHRNLAPNYQASSKVLSSFSLSRNTEVAVGPSKRPTRDSQHLYLGNPKFGRGMPTHPFAPSLSVSTKAPQQQHRPGSILNGLSGFGSVQTNVIVNI
eukprot:TRINITY_DN7279_c0_g1_i7.p1 TRINITY_DN7279_c0_g1~~TRINITY_DN7279_c0_g1_i7.p1  ORF type:complete len:1493 (-),score=387.72 TRINITY_DN7279_c0_g1_i7:72-4550(-)